MYTFRKVFLPFCNQTYHNHALLTTIGGDAYSTGRLFFPLYDLIKTRTHEYDTDRTPEDRRD